MKLLEKIRALFKKKQAPAPEPVKLEKMKRTCKACGKTVTVNPEWEHIPNYCKECKQRFAREKEEKQRAGAPRKIRRTCKSCGRVFTFPSTLEHYPSYCLNCRKTHQAQMKARYGQAGRKAGGKKDSQA